MTQKRGDIMNNSVKPKFGKTLKGMREDRDLSIRQFAKICDFSPAYISDLEKDNRKPTLELINRISNNLILTEEEKNSMKNAFIHDYNRPAANRIGQEVSRIQNC